MLYPFLFIVYPKKEGDPGSHGNLRPIKWIVVIALAGGKNYDTEWMDEGDGLLPNGYTLEPSIDLFKDEHIFYTERDALAFIKEWWVNRNLDERVTAQDLLQRHCGEEHNDV